MLYNIVYNVSLPSRRQGQALPALCQGRCCWGHSVVAAPVPTSRPCIQRAGPGTQRARPGIPESNVRPDIMIQRPTSTAHTRVRVPSLSRARKIMTVGKS